MKVAFGYELKVAFGSVTRPYVFPVMEQKGLGIVAPFPSTIVQGGQNNWTNQIKDDVVLNQFGNDLWIWLFIIYNKKT